MRIFVAATVLAIATSSLTSTRAVASETDGASFPPSYFAQFHPNSALDMVQRLPGFSFDPGDPTQRGMAEASGNVVIDGKRTADKTFTLDEVLAHIPAAQVDHIELIRNGSSGIDMLGQPIVANVVRRAAAAGSAAATLSGSLYADGRFAPGLTVERSRSSASGRSLSLSASISRYAEVDKGDGDRVRRNADGASIERTRVSAAAGGTTGYAQATAELPGLGGRLRLNGTMTWTDYHDHQTDAGLLPGNVTTTFDENLSGFAGGQAGIEVGANLARAVGTHVDTETTLSARIGRKSYGSVLAAPGTRTAFDEQDRTAEALARTRVSYHPSPALTAALDLEGAYNHLGTASSLSFDDLAIPLPNADAQVSEIRHDVGTTITWEPTPKLELQASLHEEASFIVARSDTGVTAAYRFLRPGVHLHWSPSSSEQLRLRIQRTAGQLDFANFIAAASLDKGVVSAGNTTLRPDSAWLAEAAYEWRSASHLTFLITYRHSWLGDVIDRVPVFAPGTNVASFDAPGNIGSGTEDLVTLNATIPLGRLISASELKLATTYRRDRVTDPTTGEQRQISALKPFVLTADFHQDLSRWKAAWGATFDAGWRTRTYLYDEVDTNAASALLTIFADWNPRPNLSIHLEASDVLSRRYRRIIDLSDGSRGAADLLYRDDRRLSLGPAVTLRVRRGF